MKLKEAGIIDKKGIHGKSYDTDGPLSVDDIISVIKSYEDENTKMFECRCDTFSESGNPYSPCYRNTEILKAMHNLPNPSINVRVIYVDPKDMSYKFSLGMAANTRGMNYFVNPKAEEYIRYTLELDRIKREAAERKKNAEAFLK